MKKLIAGLISGIVLGASGVGLAAGGYWSGNGTGYKCEGYYGAAICNQSGYGTRYSVMVKSGTVVIFQGKNDPIFECKRGYSAYRCTDYRG